MWRIKTLVIHNRIHLRDVMRSGSSTAKSEHRPWEGGRISGLHSLQRLGDGQQEFAGIVSTEWWQGRSWFRDQGFRN